jgi:hypothetical protein
MGRLAIPKCSTGEIIVISASPSRFTRKGLQSKRATASLAFHNKIKIRKQMGVNATGKD